MQSVIIPLILSQRICLLVLSDQRLFTAPLSEYLFTIPVRQRVPYYLSLRGFPYYLSLRGFCYYSSPTMDSWLHLAQGIPLLSQSDRRFFICPLRGYCFTPLRQWICLSFSQEMCYHSGPTEDSLFFLFQRICLTFQSGNGFFIIPLPMDLFHYSSPATDSLLFLSQQISLLFKSDKGFFHILRKRITN